ncbi:MAG: CotH kinase family protein [Bacteroidia bacterium]|nr:CotH kinase family protein [Bacteroidia bacterium]
MKKAIFIFLLIPFWLEAQQNDGDSLFNLPVVHDIYLDFAQNNFWDTLVLNHDTDIYTLCNLTINGQVIDSIGVKLKGNSSYNNPSLKKSMKLDLNEFVSGKKYNGLKKFNLNNVFKDPSFLREKITLDLFNELGIPAPRCSYANVYLNNEYWGFYTVVEEVNGNFLNQRFADNDSNLYKGDPHGDLRWKGVLPSSYYSDYELDAKSDSSNDWRDLVHLIDKINNTPTNQFYDSLETILNTYDFIRYWALTNLFVNLDSYIGSGHNYYLYHNSLTNRFEWVVWDVNESFGNFKLNLSTQQIENFSLFYSGQPGSRPLIEKMVQNNPYKTQLADYTCEVLRTYFTEDYLFPKIDSIANIIRPYVYADPKKTYSNQQFENNLNQTITTTGPNGVFTILGIKPFISARINAMFSELQPYGCFAVSSETEIQEAFNLYPNPASGQITVSISGYQSPGTLKIYTLSGQKAQENPILSENTQVSTKNLSPGVYFYEIRVDETVKGYGKLVIQP